MFLRPTTVVGWAEARSLALDFPAMPTPSVPVRLTLVPPPSPKWTRRLLGRARLAVSGGAAAVVPGRADAAQRCESLADSIAAFGSIRGDIAFDISEALRLLSSHLSGAYAADRRGHVAFLVIGSFVLVAPLDLVPEFLTGPGFRLFPLVGFLAESIRGDIDLFRDWLRWEDADYALPVSLTEAFDSWARAERS